VEKLCDQISIIRDGRIVETGTLSDMRHLSRTSIQAELAQAPTDLASLGGVHNVQITGNRLTCQVDTTELDTFLRHLANHGVRNLVSQPPTLEELFLRHYELGRARETPVEAVQ